ncbi:MAG TPA: transglycosylase domain-containing protein, partial [Patescibacteria group bacterium]|nr:transglycosylase domain-containing protein [Patescibacteria group bacterium]
MVRYGNYSPGSSRLNRVRRTRNPFSNVVVLSKLSRFALYAVIGALVVFFLYFLWVSRDLPTPGKLANSGIKDSTKILDKNGIVLYSIFQNYNRLYVPLSDIPKNLQQATIATEDRTFYTNQGFSVTGFVRGVILDPLLHRNFTGGSTITQQLVKNTLLSPERSITRKIKELILAIEVDKRFTKSQILEMYLNNVPYGGTAVGVEAAANMYFGKHASELDFAQCAFLAGLPQAPSIYSPFAGHGKAYIDRTKTVLDSMREVGEISSKQEADAIKEVNGFTFTEEQGNLKAPHFVQYVRDQLVKLYGDAVVESGNLTVKTTLDYNIQKQAEGIVKKEVADLKSYKVGNGAAVVMDPKTGAILAMVGS